MITFIIIIVVAVAFLAIEGFERLKVESFISKIVDNQKIDGKYITPQTQEILDQLNKPSAFNIIRYTNAIKLSDGQQISYLTDSIENFKRHSKLNYEPTKTEWKVLMKVVSKVYNGYVKSNITTW